MADRVARKPRLSASRQRLAHFLEAHGVPPDGYDYVLFGDGSGSAKTKPYGYACVLVERETRRREVFFGAGNRGSSIYAELTAFSRPIGWIVDKVAEERKNGRLGPVRVYCFTDNSYTATYMDGQHDGPPSHRIVRAAVQVAKAHGIFLIWKHIHRETATLNAYVDRVSRAANKRLAGLDPNEEAGIVSVKWASP